MLHIMIFHAKDRIALSVLDFERETDISSSFPKHHTSQKYEKKHFYP